MRTAHLIQKVEDLISSMNSKQQQIAKQLILDSRYEIIEMDYRNNQEVFLKELKSGELFHFLTFIKSKCNCD